jgi:putative transposase
MTVRVGVGRIKRLRKQRGIRCKQQRQLVATTHSRHHLPVAEHLLHQTFAASKPNAAWPQANRQPSSLPDLNKNSAIQ